MERFLHCFSLIRFAAFSSLCIFICSRSFAQQPAFPGAEGNGKFVTGGRGTIAIPTTVFEVTNLNDNVTIPPIGSLRWAITNNSPVATYRTVVFKVSGTIHLAGALSINRANTTIAGQTAPGDGICVADYPVTLGADNLIVRFIRFRMGDKNQNTGMVNGAGSDDAFGGTGRKNIVIDHCTTSWSDDEALSIYRGDSTTIQWNLISEPLNYSYHFETGDADFEHHGYGGIWGGRHASFHHNLLAHCQGRVPRFDGSRNLPSSASPVVGSENVDFRNNVLYNWGSYNVNGGEGGNYNIVNNYYKYGPSTSTNSSSGVAVKSMVINPYKQTSPVLPYGQYYLNGNYVDGYQTITDDNWKGAAMSGGSLSDTSQAKVTTPFDIAPAVTTQTALDVFELVLQNAGVIFPARDTLDQRIVNDVRNRTGRIIDVQGGYPHGTPYTQTAGAWPTLNSTNSPVDTDHDGMQDSWESANGSNLNDAGDRNIIDPNGYTKLENYLNSLTAGSALPSRLLSFNGSADGQNIKLLWNTVNELNTSTFIVERSIDGVTYKAIGSIKTEKATAAYSYTDKQSLNEVAYYRLKMEDKDGRYTYSSIISFNNKFTGQLSIYPNPVINGFTAMHSKAIANAGLQVVSNEGKVLIQQKVSTGAIQTSMSTFDLKAGIYWLVYTNNGNRSIKKFERE